MAKLNEKVGTFFFIFIAFAHIFLIVDFIIFFDKTIKQLSEKNYEINFVNKFGRIYSQRKTLYLIEMGL
ncbi:MAG: hypothetical protein ACTHKJ_09695 [Candidatus Nitrosocosmicus sp.]